MAFITSNIASPRISQGTVMAARSATRKIVPPRREARRSSQTAAIVPNTAALMATTKDSSSDSQVGPSRPEFVNSARYQVKVPTKGSVP